MNPVNPPHPRGPSRPASGSSTTTKKIPTMPINEDTIKNFQLLKTFPCRSRISDINFSQNGDFLISSLAEDDRMIIYDCTSGKQQRVINCQTYGADLAQFTHASNTVIHTSTKVNDAIRYLSLYDNKYLRFFPGHTGKVTTLCMSPESDKFLSCSQDKTLRIWDLRSPDCEATVSLGGSRPVGAIDPQGLIFGVGLNSESVKLYDLRKFEKGPFSNFQFTAGIDKEEWSSLKFSPNGKLLLICCNQSGIMLLADAYDGTPLQTLSDIRSGNPQQFSAEACFTPNSQFVISATAQGLVHIWDMSGTKICSLPASQCHPSPIGCVKFNPKYMMMTTTCKNLTFWMPSIMSTTG